MIKHLFTLTVLIALAHSPLFLQAQQASKPYSFDDHPIGTLKKYDLTVDYKTVNFTSRDRKALATNGSIPAPTLYFIEGDTALITVKNNTNKPVSFHWHGIILPNKEDGVPMLTTEIIKAGGTHVFKFPIIQYGTYWYHSHTMFQEQKGLYGAIVIQPNNEEPTNEKVVVLSDWTDQKAKHIQRQLKRHTEWYAMKRNAIQSYGKAIATGNLSAKLWLEWKRMPDMDLADVYYDKFLINGKLEDSTANPKNDKTVKLRVINGSSSSHFWLHYAGGKMKIVAADGIDITPVSVDKILIATAETYDIEVAVATDTSYEFRATSWDRYRHTSLWVGEGEKVKTKDLAPVDYFSLINEMKDMMSRMKGMKMGKAPKIVPAPKLYQPEDAPSYSKEEMNMDMGSHDHKQMNHSKGKMNMDMKESSSMSDMTDHKPFSTMMTGYKQIKENNPTDVVFDYNMLRAKESTVLPESNPVRVVHLYLTGNMFRYVWTMNNKPLSRADKIMINKEENVRFVMHNTTMMSHPMHLHGHFFRVINDTGALSPLKHTVNIAPMQNITIEFEASEEKDWFFHCHLLYHMMSGMARVVSYANTNPMLDSKKDYNKFAREDKRYYSKATAMTHSNGTFADLSLFNIYNELSIEGDANYNKEYNLEAKLMRYIDPKQFFVVYAGLETEQNYEYLVTEQRNGYKSETLGIIGVRYFLPLHFWSDLRVDHTGNFQIEIEREDIPLTKRWAMGGGVEYNFNNTWEYRVITSYRLLRNLAVSANYYSNYGLGAGLSFIY